MPMRPEARVCGARDLCSVVALAVLVLTAPVRAHTQDDLTVFLEALTETPESAQLLDPLIQHDDRARLLLALARGDTGQVVGALLGIVESRAMNELKRTIPFLGKAILARDAGRWLSDHVWDRAATRGFENARARLTDVIPREDWPRDWESYRASGQFDAELFRNFLTHDSMVFTNAVWREHGIENADHPDAERVLFDAFWNRILVEDAFQAAGLTGRARTPDRLRAWLEDEIAFRQELALMSADRWREHLVFLESVEARAHQNALVRQAEALAVDPPVALAGEAEQAEIAIAIEIEAMAIEMETPALAMALEQPVQPAPPIPDGAVPPAVAGLVISHGTQVRGETTQHSVTIAHEGDAPVTVFLSLSALGAATSGGLGHGSIPDILSLAAGENWAAEIMVMGDHPGAILDIGRDSRAHTRLALLPAHEVEPAPEPPTAEGPLTQEDPQALWLAAPVVFAGEVRYIEEVTAWGRRHRYESIDDRLSLTFNPGGEVVLTSGDFTYTRLSVRQDNVGMMMVRPTRLSMSSQEIRLGRVGVRDGRVNLAELHGLLDRSLHERDPQDEVSFELRLDAERLEIDGLQLSPDRIYGMIVIERRSFWRLDRLNTR